MPNYSSILRLLATSVLVTLLLSAYVGREFVHLLGHEHEHSEFHCELEGVDQHVHEGEVEWHDCLLANFQVSPLEQAVDLILPASKKPILYPTLPHYLVTYAVAKDRRLPLSRGPPLV